MDWSDVRVEIKRNRLSKLSQPCMLLEPIRESSRPGRMATICLEADRQTSVVQVSVQEV